MRKPLRYSVNAVAFILLLFAVAFAYQVYRASRSQAVLRKIDQLVLLTPADQTDLEWAVLVYWMHNYHCATVPQTRASLSWLNETERQLDTAIRSEPTVDTIDAVWNRYSALMGDADTDWYDMKHERELVYNKVVRDGMEYFDTRSYLDFRDSVRSQQ